MKLEPTRHKLGACGIRKDIMIRIHHNFVLLLIFDLDVVFNIPENNLHNAVTVINLIFRDAWEDAVKESSALG